MLQVDATNALARVHRRYRGGLQRYVDDKIRPGGFLVAVLRNDLQDALARVDDDITAEQLRVLVRWVYQYVPSHAWGSKDRVEAWIASSSP